MPRERILFFLRVTLYVVILSLLISSIWLEDIVARRHKSDGGAKSWSAVRGTSLPVAKRGGTASLYEVTKIAASFADTTINRILADDRSNNISLSQHSFSVPENLKKNESIVSKSYTIPFVHARSSVPAASLWRYRPTCPPRPEQPPHPDAVPANATSTTQFSCPPLTPDTGEVQVESQCHELLSTTENGVLSAAMVDVPSPAARHEGDVRAWLDPATSRHFPPCLRIASAVHRDNGLGHRYGAVLFVANIAHEFGFSLVLGDILRQNYSQNYFPSFRSLLGLDYFMYESELEALWPARALTRFVVASREEFLLAYRSTYRHACDVLVQVKLGGAACRGSVWPGAEPVRSYCFRLWPGAFERARRLLHPHLPRLNATALSLFATAREGRALVVAWHLRCGDITLRRPDEFFLEIRRLLEASGVPHRHYLFWRGCGRAMFDRMLDLLPGNVVLEVLSLHVIYLKGTRPRARSNASHGSAHPRDQGKGVAAWPTQSFTVHAPPTRTAVSAQRQSRFHARDLGTSYEPTQPRMRAPRLSRTHGQDCG